MHTTESSGKPFVHLLGVPSIEIEGRFFTNFRSNRIPALLGLLASKPGPWQREAVAAILWPDAMSEEGRHSLRQTIFWTKQLLGVDPFAGGRQTVELTAAIDIDIRMLLQSTNSLLPPDELISTAESVISLYHGEFLMGLNDDWIFNVRLQLSKIYVSSLITLAELCLIDQPTRALELANLAIEEEPFLDGARVLKILALKKMGEEGSAHREYKIYKKFLNDELGIDPAEKVSKALTSSPLVPAIEAASDRHNQDPTDNEPITFLVNSSRPKRGLALAVATVPYWIGKGRSGEGIDILKDVLESNSTNQDWPEYHLGKVALAELMAAEGKLYEAKQTLVDVLPKLENTTPKIQALILYARISLFGYQAKAGEEYAKQAIELAERNGSKEDQVDAMRSAAEIAFQLEDLESAEALADSCEQLAGEIGDWQSFANVVSLKAMIHLRSGRVEQARSAVNTGLIELMGKDAYRATYSRVRFYRLIEEFGDIEQAEEGYRNGIVETRAYGDQMGLAIVLTYLGDLLSVKGQFDEAMVLHEEALGIRRTANEKLGRATSLRGIGRIHLAQNRFAEAKMALNESSQLFLECDAISGHASVLLELARVAKASEQPGLAFRLAQHSQFLLSGMSRLARLTIGPDGDSLIQQADELVKSFSAQ